MDRAIEIWLKELDIDEVPGSELKLPYSIYGCMLLLSSHAFESIKWHQIRQQLSPDEFDRLHSLLAQHFKITHIALNKPIPPLENRTQLENVLRSPTNFTPLYGDFGSTTCSSPPTQTDFDSAFWVTAKQNGIFQTWAPRWTMFSRGNISEKARLLDLFSVQQAVQVGKDDGRGCAAVDLYAGIGYFTFSYLRAGVSQVLCWDLNPWSTEGLKRGAAANKWSTKTMVENEALDSSIDAEARIVIFNETNERVPTRLKQMRDRLAPIRHVNCGLLPTSRPSWQIAFNVLDTKLGGWIHVHENFAVQEIEQKSEEVRVAFQQMVADTRPGITVQIEYINRLKSYAPGVMHCVLDLFVPPYHTS